MGEDLVTCSATFLLLGSFEFIVSLLLGVATLPLSFRQYRKQDPDAEGYQQDADMPHDEVVSSCDGTVTFQVEISGETSGPADAEESACQIASTTFKQKAQGEHGQRETLAPDKAPHCPRSKGQIRTDKGLAGGQRYQRKAKGSAQAKRKEEAREAGGPPW
jgi:hypothetical protein